MHSRTRILLASIFLVAAVFTGNSWGEPSMQQTLNAHDPFSSQSIEQPENTVTTAPSGSTQPSVEQMTSLLEGLTSLLEKLTKEYSAALERGDQKDPTEAKGKTGTVHVHTFLNFRSSPWGTILDELHNGDKVEIIGKEGDWYKVRVNGKIGYSYAKYVSQDSSAATSTSTSTSNLTSTSAPGKSKTPATSRSGKTSGTPNGVLRGTGSPMKVKATGYFPPPPGGYKSKAEAAMEGGANDCRGKPLRTLQDYNPRDPKSYVSCATDPRVIKTGTWFTLDEFPGIRFLACDVGGGIKGKHIDICCKTEKETYKLPSSVTVRTLK